MKFINLDTEVIIIVDKNDCLRGRVKGQPIPTGFWESNDTKQPIKLIHIQRLTTRIL